MKEVQPYFGKPDNQEETRVLPRRRHGYQELHSEAIDEEAINLRKKSWFSKPNETRGRVSCVNF